MEQLNLKVTLNSNGSVTSTWSPVSNLLWYEVTMYWQGKRVVIFREEKYYGTSYTSPADLDANEMYKVVVVARRSSGGDISDGKEILIRSDFYNNTPLGVPQNVTATADAASVTVRFDKVARATGYDILFDNVTYSVTNTTKVFGGLSPKTNHTYAV